MSVLEKTGFYAAILTILALLCLIVFSRNGVLDYKRLKVRETIILEQGRTADLENQTLENEINSLKTDMEYIKHLAKQEHDMTEQDEFIFKDKSGNNRSTE